AGARRTGRPRPHLFPQLPALRDRRARTGLAARLPVRRHRRPLPGPRGTALLPHRLSPSIDKRRPRTGGHPKETTHALAFPPPADRGPIVPAAGRRGAIPRRAHPPERRLPARQDRTSVV